jgi:hypothetical protein
MLQVFQSSMLSSREKIEGVHLEIMPRFIFQAVRVGQRGYWILYIHM